MNGSSGASRKDDELAIEASGLVKAYRDGARAVRR